MPNPVVIEDIEARFRSLVDTEIDGVQALIDDAWAVLLTVVPDIEDRMTAGTISTEVAVFVVTAMVIRVLRNPNGIRSWSVDDYSETRDNSLSAGNLYPSDLEIALLTGRANSVRRGAFSISTSQATQTSPGSEAEYIEALRYGDPRYVYPPASGWCP